MLSSSLADYKDTYLPLFSEERGYLTLSTQKKKKKKKVKALLLFPPSIFFLNILSGILSPPLAAFSFSKRKVV